MEGIKMDVKKAKQLKESLASDVRLLKKKFDGHKEIRVTLEERLAGIRSGTGIAQGLNAKKHKSTGYVGRGGREPSFEDGGSESDYFMPTPDSEEEYDEDSDSKNSEDERSPRNDDHDSATESAGDDHVETEASLRGKISGEDTKIDALRSRILALEEDQNVASSTLVKAEKKLTSIQMEMDAFCALKRSEVWASLTASSKSPHSAYVVLSQSPT
jgi:hypothetical protein